MSCPHVVCTHRKANGCKQRIDHSEGVAELEADRLSFSNSSWLNFKNSNNRGI